MVYLNKGPNYRIKYNAYDIAAEDAATGEILAYYIGYYNAKTKTFKLYPSELTEAGKEANYKMEVKTLGESQIKGFSS